MKQLDTLVPRWKELKGVKGSSEEFKWTQEQIKVKLDDLEEEIKDLNEAISMAETSKKKIDPKELTKRKKFVSDSEGKIKDVKRMLENASLTSNKKDMFGMGESKDKYDKLNDYTIEDNQNYIDQVMQEQEKIKEQQSKGLDQVIIGVDRLKDHGQVLGDTLEDQKKDLEKLDQEAGRTKGLLQRANQQMNQLLKGSDSGKIICIVILVIIIVVMIVLFFSLQ